MRVGGGGGGGVAIGRVREGKGKELGEKAAGWGREGERVGVVACDAVPALRSVGGRARQGRGAE